MRTGILKNFSKKSTEADKMEKILSESLLGDSENKKLANIDNLTVAEAKNLGYKLLSPEKQVQLAGLVRKVKVHRAIDKEFENTISNTNTVRGVTSE